jgi:hypothetical protein
LTKLTHSDIFTKSHQIARILGYKNFPKILTDVWTIYYTYSKSYPTKNYHLKLKEGKNTSSQIVKAIYKIGHKVETKQVLGVSGHYISGTDFQLKNFSENKIPLTKSSIYALEQKLIKYSVLQNPLWKTRQFVISELATNNDGYRLLSNGDIETTSGYIIYSYKGINDVYKFPVSTQLAYDKHCLTIAKEEIKSPEAVIQASLISFWNTLTKSSELSIAVDYEVGVNSGKKVMDHKESRYDLVVSVDNKYELIELKKGIIDIATLNYKIGYMKMGVDSYCEYSKKYESKVVFVGKDIDERLTNLKSIFDKSKVEMYSYSSYIGRLEKLLKKAKLNIFDEDLAKLYLGQLKEHVKV